MKSFLSTRSGMLALLAGAVWLACASAGLGWVWKYANTPGTALAPPPEWPTASQLGRVDAQPCLVLFVHPRCPCSRATVGELRELMAGNRRPVRTQVLFYHPAGTDESWAHTALWETAAAIPGVTVAADEGGVEAARFHATTSGQALLFDGAGRCRFSGGITSARGHPGPSAGGAAVRALLRGEAPARPAAPVFGCGLACEKTSAENTSITTATAFP